MKELLLEAHAVVTNLLRSVEDLEKENEEMRKAIREAYSPLEWATRTLTPPSDWDVSTKVKEATSKLQPFLAPKNAETH